MKKIFIAFFIGAIPVWTQSVFQTPLAHTYSIVARDPYSGELGVAVQSHWFSVGSIVPWAEAGTGVVATQSFVNASFGPRGLGLLKEGKTADEVVDLLIESDEGREFRQLAIVDVHGNTAAYTGDHCIPEAGHRTGREFSVQANLMLNDAVWPAMASAFESTTGLLAERMVSALEAADSCGGDIRGRQSACLLIVRARKTDRPWEDRLIDLRVEDHPRPVQELKRLVAMYRAYEWMNAGDLAVEKGELTRALELYGKAENLFPDQLEMRYWHAVSMYNTGMKEAAMPIFKSIFEKEPNWLILTRRLPGVGLLNADAEEIENRFSSSGK